MTAGHGGVLFVDRGAQGPFRRVLVSGLGRSGTSALASMLLHLGYDLGEPLDAVNHENQTWRALLAARDGDGLFEALTAAAGRSSHVAWKDPKLIGETGLSVLSRLGPDWLVVICFRDLTANAYRRAALGEGEPLALIQHLARMQHKMAVLLGQVSQSLLFVSHEYLARDPEAALAALATHIDRPEGAPDPVTLQRLMQQDGARYRASPPR